MLPRLMPADGTHDASTDVPALIGTLGFGLFYAWNFLGFFSPVLSVPSAYTPEFEHLLRFVSLSTFTLVLFGVRRYANILSIALPRRRLLIAAALSGSLPPAVALCNMHWFVLPSPVALLAWVGFGAASGPLFLLWGGFSCTLGRSRVLTLTAISYSAGALWYLLVSYLQPTVGIITVELTLLFSVIILTANSTLVPLEPIEIGVSRARLDLYVRTAFRVVFEGIAFGLVFYLVVTGTNGAQAALVIGSATIVAGAIIVLATRLSAHRVVPWGTIQRISLPVLVVGLLALPYINTAGRMFCAFGLILMYACYDMSNWGLLAILGNEYKVQTTYHYSRGRSTIMLGLTIGWGIGHLFNYGPHGNAIAMLAISLGLAGALAIVDAIVPFGDDHLAMLEGPETRVRAPGSWRQRCVKVAEAHGLSPREFEVFLFLAKGRNTAHIERSLLISGHTIKTHIYRIYRKLGVNTQQELIDLVVRS
ncbi:MAG: response regulator transcription factor [Coriobacteriia bacterium]